MKNLEKKALNRNNGITLIALVVTIIVLLILAGISISVLSGENGLITRVKDAKQESIIGEEKEQVELAYASAKIKKINEYITEGDLQEELDLSVGNKKTKVTPYKSVNLKVKFEVTGNVYEVNQNGRITKKEKVIIPENLKIGSSINYIPVGNTYVWQAEYASSDLTPVTDDRILDSSSEGNSRITSWVVFKIDEKAGEIQIIPKNTLESTVRLQGAQGYNNGVKMLNDACSELYKNDENGITARNINREDIEKLILDEKLETIKDGVGIQTSYDYTSYKYYPLIYEQEVNSVINENEKIEGLGISDSYDKFIGRTDKTSLNEGETITSIATNGYIEAKTNIQPYTTVYRSHQLYSWNTGYKSNSEEYINMFRDRNREFWIASRGISCSSTGVNYCLHAVLDGSINSIVMIRSNTAGVHDRDYSIFPVVTVSCEFIKEDGSEFRVDLSD